MKKILFVCHGNICRSVTAEFVFRHMAEEAGVGYLFEVDSAATSREEIGNPIYPLALHTMETQTARTSMAYGTLFPTTRRGR